MDSDPSEPRDDAPSSEPNMEIVYEQRDGTCKFCSFPEVERRNGTPLCERHLQEYIVRNS